MTARERLLLGLALPAVLVGAGYQLAWTPIEASRAEARAEIAAWRQLRAAAARAGGPAPEIALPDRGPLGPRVTRSAEGFGIAPSRLEPEGERLRVVIDEAPWEDLVLWIAAMESDEGLRLAAAEVDRRAAPGAVSARLTLEEMR